MEGTERDRVDCGLNPSDIADTQPCYLNNDHLRQEHKTRTVSDDANEKEDSQVYEVDEKPVRRRPSRLTKRPKKFDDFHTQFVNRQVRVFARVNELCTKSDKPKSETKFSDCETLFTECRRIRATAREETEFSTESEERKPKKFTSRVILNSQYLKRHECLQQAEKGFVSKSNECVEFMRNTDEKVKRNAPREFRDKTGSKILTGRILRQSRIEISQSECRFSNQSERCRPAKPGSQ